MGLSCVKLEKISFFGRCCVVKKKKKKNTHSERKKFHPSEKAREGEESRQQATELSCHLPWGEGLGRRGGVWKNQRAKRVRTVIRTLRKLWAGLGRKRERERQDQGLILTGWSIGHAEVWKTRKIYFLNIWGGCDRLSAESDWEVELNRLKWSEKG